MADTPVNESQANYYFDLTPDAQDIDNVLIDLVAALKNTGENKVVIRKKASESQDNKPHFILGEGGGSVPSINANKSEIIVGDGNNWAEGNGHGYYITYSNNNQENIIGSLLDIPVAFGSLAAPIEEETAPTLKNGYKAQGNAIADISGDARLYMGETSRLAIHDDAWMDVTGNGTQVKFNSGSKFYVDSMYGKNNMYMHGGFIVINDAKEPSYSRPVIYYRVEKTDYPDRPDNNYEWFEQHGEIFSKSKDFSTNYPYKTAEDSIITNLTDIQDLYDENYEYVKNTNVSETGWQKVDGVYKYTQWYIAVTYEKLAVDIPEVHITGDQPYNYSNDGDWPEESINVPRINITGAPHIRIQDYSNVLIETGARLDLNKQCQLVASESFTSLLSSHLIMQSQGASTPIHPYIMLNDEDSAAKHQISFGFTTVNPKSASIPAAPILSDMLNTPAQDHCNISITQETLGPYNNFVGQRLNFNGNGYMVDWMTGKIGSIYKYNLLPLIHFGERVYIQASVGSGSYCIINPQIENGSKYIYAPDITGSSMFDVAPYLSNGSKFAAKFGGTNSSETCIQYSPAGGYHSFLIDPVNSKTYFHDLRENNTILATEIKSIANSNILFTLSAGMGKDGYVNGNKLGQNSSGTIQKMIEGIDTFELESGYIHKEMRDYSRFIMRGENVSYNSPGYTYQNDSSQFDNIDKMHLQKYWGRPINNENFDKSPTFQMYECSNLILRGWWNYPTFTNIKISTTAYSHLSGTQIISLEEFKSHTVEWEEFLAYFSDRNAEFIGLVPESEIIASPVDITINQARVQYIGDTSHVKKYHPNAGLDTFGKRSSLLEITDNSELRLWDGICIYARYNPETNEPGIEIINRYNKNGTDGSGATGEIDRVEFTFNELKALKQLVSSLTV